MSGVYELLTKGVVSSSHHDHPASRRGATDVPDFTSQGLIFQSAYRLADGRCSPQPTCHAKMRFIQCLLHILEACTCIYSPRLYNLHELLQAPDFALNAASAGIQLSRTPPQTSQAAWTTYS